MLVGLFLLFWQFKTLNIQEILHGASLNWQAGSDIAIAVTALLFGGAVGKSGAESLR